MRKHRGSGGARGTGIGAQDWGLLAMRVAIGGTLIAHGSQKLFGWFGGGGLARTAAGFHRNGFRPGQVHATLAALGETGGGALLVAGLATPGAAAAATSTMVVASSTHVQNGFFSRNRGFELPGVLGATAAGLALTGPGALSLDHALGHRLNRPWMRPAALAVAIPVAVGIAVRRRQVLAAEAAEAAKAEAEQSTEQPASPNSDAGRSADAGKSGDTRTLGGATGAEPSNQPS